MKTLATVALASTLAFGAGSAFAQADTTDVLHPGNADFTNEGTVGPWTVYGDTDRGTCLIEGVDPNGYIVQMGLTADDRFGYVGIFTDKDFGAVEGQTQPIQIVVNDNAYVGEVAEMRGNVQPGFQGGYVLASDPQFATDIQKSYEMTFVPANGTSAVINLDGTYDAIEAAKACNAKMAAM
ncbi:hypothetical protein [Roseovarius dicentrarchi]|uniref:hypothetical protein n=1 Tax=Roseovarius dicentrarchi TaxID=2250573 RepID=UPI000DE9E1BC|nr:hypothetical protein [Roseovarius dicentrarchi]